LKETTLSHKSKIVPTNRQARYFNVARKTSFKSDYARCHLGAVIVKGNYIVSKGFNQTKSHPAQFHYNQDTRYQSSQHSIHAEVDALVKSKDTDLEGAEIYIYRENAAADLASSRPCPACQRAISESGISTIFYTSPEGFHCEAVEQQ
jgi:deoxycytidylate deaminase